MPMDRLVHTTLKYGLIPPVIMEFPGITAGGGYAGTAGESSSYKHGFFDRSLNSVEMVLANGDIAKVSESENPDLFHGAAGAVGTLGVTTLVEIQLMKAKKYVETTYHPVSSVAEAIKKIREATADPELDYVDGILYSKTEGAIVTGRLTDTVGQDIKTQTFSRARDPWFYLHAKKSVFKKSKPVVEAIPLEEYLLRYDRGGFWVGASAFKYFMFPFNRFTRWFLDDFLHTRMMYVALHASGHSKKYFVQDLALPYSTASKFIDYVDEDLGIYPLWLCPLKQSKAPTIHPHFVDKDGKQEELLNIGVWGQGPTDEKEFITANRKMETKLKEFGGMKWFYAQTYYTENEFWEVYDRANTNAPAGSTRTWYEALREKYHATTLPSVYDKIKQVEKSTTGKSFSERILSTRPFSGMYGLYKAIQSKQYLLTRKSTWKSIEPEEEK